MVPNYEQIENALLSLRSPYCVEDSHGMLCAMLIVDDSLQCARWLDEICAYLQDEDTTTTERETLCAFYECTKRELNDSLLGFELLMPEQDCNLRLRIGALKKWCDGFLFGLVLSGVNELTHMPEDSKEILQDITTIAQANEEEEESELNEAAYMNIIEYVRTGVLLINEELHSLNCHPTIQ